VLSWSHHLVEPCFFKRIISFFLRFGEVSRCLRSSYYPPFLLFNKGVKRFEILQRNSE
jgi:hypothetical protein